MIKHKVTMILNSKYTNIDWFYDWVHKCRLELEREESLILVEVEVLE